MTEKISIIIPCFNSAKTIAECLNSAQKIDYKNYEIIVVDDASIDDSIQIIKKFKCRLIKLKKNVGAAEARNIGAKNAGGDILLFMDADIIMPKNALKLAISFFKEKKADVFFASFKPELRFKNFFSQYKHLYLCYYYKKQHEIVHTIDTSFCFIKKKIFDKFNGFNKEIRISEDIDLGVRLTGKGYKIYRAKHIKMEHIKYYSFLEFVRADLIRSERISKIFLSSLFGKRRGGNRSFYLRPMNIYVSVPLTSAILLTAVLTAIFQNLIFLLLTVNLLIIFSIVNLDFWNYLRKVKGVFFAFFASFINLFDMLVMNIGVFITLLSFIIKRTKI